jgi:RNA polymerase sigma-70 factor, ECF subfamily
MVDTTAGRESDQRVLVRISERDSSALADLYDRYSVLIYTAALRMTHDAHAAEALVIAVFQAVWHSAEHSAGAESVTAWLLTIVRDRAREMTPQQRQYGIDGVHMRHGVAGATAHMPCLGSTHEAEAGAEPAVPPMQAALLSLPIVQRRAIELSYYDGFTHAEIAAYFKMPVHAVKAALREGLIRLHELGGAPKQRSVGQD